MTRSLVVVSAGLSTPSSTRSLADQLAQATTAAIGARGEGVEITTIEVRDLLPALTQVMSTGGMSTPQLDQVKDQLTAADGIIMVTPVFAGSYAGIFKMFCDTLDPDALSGIPVMIAATAGTPRHSLVLDHALRPLLTYFRAMVMPTGVFAATGDFANPELSQRVHRAADELASAMVSTASGVEGFRPTQAPARRSGTDPHANEGGFMALFQQQG